MSGFLILYQNIYQILDKQISFSSSLNHHLKSEGRILRLDEHPIQSGKIYFSVTKGAIEIFGTKVPYYNLPHLNYPIKVNPEMRLGCFGKPRY